MVTDSQVDLILDRIRKSGITNTQLQNDLLDHYCCIIEEETEKDIDFEQAYSHAFQAINPGGMHEIQEELFFLLTFKKQTNMKRLIYGSGFFAAMLISTGIMFRIVHWPGANYIFECGFLALIVTIAAITGNALRQHRTNSRAFNVRMFIGMSAGLLISLGNLFKLHSFPGANIQMVVGMCLLNFVFLPMFFYQLYRQALVKS